MVKTFVIGLITSKLYLMCSFCLATTLSAVMSVYELNRVFMMVTMVPSSFLVIGLHISSR